MDNKDIPERVKVVNFNEMKDCNVFQGDSYGGIFPLPGAQVTITQNYGQQGKKPTDATMIEGKVESKEERENRKSKIIEEIISKFDFSEEQLGYDNNRKKLTNEKIAILFAQIFGLRGAHPSSNSQTLVEQLWCILIDERNQCSKRAGEDYFRQTVLNILGYFVSNGLLSGMPRDLARSVFPETDTNEAKNVTRGISSNVFPKGIAEHIDLYIDKLQNGKI